MSGLIPPIEEMVTDEMLAALPEKERAQWEDAIEKSKLRKRLIAQHAHDGEWDEALLLCDSAERAPLLIRAAEVLLPNDLRKLLADNWSTTEAWSGVPELREGMMNAIRKAAPVIVPSEDALRLQKPPEGRFKVYRGNLGETPSGGSWSLGRKTAEMFVRLATGPRGQIVFGYPADGTGTIWEADCDAEDVLGFFDDRQEYEIVTDRVRNVRKIAELVTVERPSYGIGADTVEEAS